MPILLAIVGAFFSGVVMWIIWGNGMQVIHHWLDGRTEKAKSAKDMRVAIESRERAATAPLRAMNDPREVALALLTKLAMLRGEITAEQNLALTRIASIRMGLPGIAEHHTTLAAFAARAIPDVDRFVGEITARLAGELSREEADDLFALMDEIAALHGGPTEAQTAMIARFAQSFDRGRWQG